MNYWAGKLRIGPKIAQAMLTYLDHIADSLSPGGASDLFDGYGELFLGMGGVMQHMVGPLEERFPPHDDDDDKGRFQFLGIDVNERVMEFWKQVQRGWIPPRTLSHEQYVALKQSAHEACSALHTFVGYACGFHGCYFRGNAPPDRVETRIRRNFNNVERARQNMITDTNIHFETADFFDIVDRLPSRHIYYLDPPYENTLNDTGAVRSPRAAASEANHPKRRSGARHCKASRFDSAEFWRAATRLADPRSGNLVFVSETHAPPDWICIWENVWKHNHNGKSYARTEKLFVHESTHQQFFLPVQSPD